MQTLELNTLIARQHCKFIDVVNAKGKITVNIVITNIGAYYLKYSNVLLGKPEGDIGQLVSKCVFEDFSSYIHKYMLDLHMYTPLPLLADINLFKNFNICVIWNADTIDIIHPCQTCPYKKLIHITMEFVGPISYYYSQCCVNINSFYNIMMGLLSGNLIVFDELNVVNNNIIKKILTLPKLHFRELNINGCENLTHVEVNMKHISNQIKSIKIDNNPNIACNTIYELN